MTRIIKQRCVGRRWRMMSATIALMASILASCGEPCSPTFTDGQIVKHVLNGNRYVVLSSSRVTNAEGLCLVNVRGDDGRQMNLAVAELKP